MGEEAVIYEVEDFKGAARNREQSILALLRSLVELESPSDEKAAVDRCLEFTAEAAARLGARVRRHRRRDAGDVLEARFGPENSGRGARNPFCSSAISIRSGRSAP